MTISVITDNTTVQNFTEDNHYTGTDDIYMGALVPTYTYESDGSTSMNVDNDAGDEYNSLLRPNGISNISPSDTVNSATLYVRTVGGFGTIDVSVYGCLRPWVRTEATWNEYSTGLSWSVGGGEGSGTDHQVTADGTFSASASNAWYSVDVTDISQDIIDGTISNNGAILDADGGSGFWAFARYDGIDGNRWEWGVDHTAAAVSAAIIGGGLVNSLKLRTLRLIG